MSSTTRRALWTARPTTRRREILGAPHDKITHLLIGQWVRVPVIDVPLRASVPLPFTCGVMSPLDNTPSQLCPAAYRPPR